MILASGGIVAAIPLTNTAFATCGLGTQDIHCSGQTPTVGPGGPPVLGASAGNFKLISLLIHVHSVGTQQ